MRKQANLRDGDARRPSHREENGFGHVFGAHHVFALVNPGFRQASHHPNVGIHGPGETSVVRTPDLASRADHLVHAA